MRNSNEAKYLIGHKLPDEDPSLKILSNQKNNKKIENLEIKYKLPSKIKIKI